MSEKGLQKLLKGSGYKYNQKLKQYVKEEAVEVLQDEYNSSNTGSLQ